MNLNINQFSQVPIRGQLDLQISKSGVLTGQISVNETNTLKAGDKVKLDSANTGPIPQFLLAANEDPAIGFLAYDVKRATAVAGDAVEVTFKGGAVMWMVAGAAIVPGALVQQQADTVGSKVITLASDKQSGIALDPASGDTVLLRVIVDPALS